MLVSSLSADRISPPDKGHPLVTIGIPAYNRPAGLGRAIRSELEQDYREVEVLVSDDASPDPAVERTALKLADADPRLRYVRQPRNLGHAGNYQWVLQAARGQYFMWLADDDWIDPDYVGYCLAALVTSDDTILVCGSGRYYMNEAHTIDERPINLSSARPGVRLLQYFARVSVNGPLFGVARRDDVLAMGFPPVVGGDWMLVASMAARGHVQTLDGVHIHRSLTGLGADGPSLARSFGMSGLAARNHHNVVAARVWRDVALGAGAFRNINSVARVLVATAAAGLIVIRFTAVRVVRQLVGERVAAALEGQITAWLRARDSG